MNSSRFLNWLEKTGNRLPDPTMLFIVGIVAIIALSEIAVRFQWHVIHPAQTHELISANSILSSEGLWWWFSHLVENFTNFPPLGIVLVGMLGIGLAERSGFLGCLIMTMSRLLAQNGLIPATLFLGIISSFALDAGYVVLPPIAAVMFQRMGYSPVAGIAVSFAGVSAGFGANLFITSLDPLLAGFTQSAAQIVNPDYQIAVTCNWWFMIASTVILTMVGTYVSRRWVVPHTMSRIGSTNLGQFNEEERDLNERQRKGLNWAVVGLVVYTLAVLVVVYKPGAFLHGQGEHFSRWVEVTVPLLFFFFMIPGLIFGCITQTIKTSKDFAQMLGEIISDLGPYIVLAFFAAQFIALFKFTHMGEMLAISAGTWLSSSQLPIYVLLCAFVLLVCAGNLLIGSMSAKYALFSPVFVPMLLLAQVPPELTQAAYRIGDSVTNVITPLNPYMVIILALLRKYDKQAGVGTLVSLMVPYSIAFLLAWMLLLIIWVALGIPLGPGSTI